ncbi:hypothetical protein KFK09_017727 [Dendrobium nobile]|uniref:Endonuclease/exonuclease/phosphatase domain-containing protein n=1 Tax=Dendrobium nobile TaxID=94219 RepID=A0A8T3ASU7_DENNO|nr:hypothetical protein KFK09_017727 [Dendrobium nobile]
MEQNEQLDLDSGRHINLMKDNVELGLNIEVKNKFEAFVEDIEEGEMVNHITVEQSRASLAVEETLEVMKEADVVVNDVKTASAVSSNVVKFKLAKEVKTLGPLEPEHRKGAKKSEVSLYLKEIVRDYDVFYIRIVETKLNNVDRKDVDSLMGGSWDYFHFPVVGNSGGILVLWDRNVASFVVEESSSQVVVGDLTTPSYGVWKVAIVYRSNCYVERRSLWRLLENSLAGNGQSLVGGDFNCILSRDEKKGEKRFLLSR